MAMSYVLYIGVLVVCWLAALLADRYNDKKGVWFIVITLTLISGLRAYTVGIDTAVYVEKFGYIQRGVPELAYGFETSFKYFCYVILKIFPNYSVLFTILAFITNACIVRRLWDFRKVASFGTMVACYYMGFFFMSLNTVRQFCAIAIILYSTRYLVKHQDFRYILGVMAASVFHQSALIGITLLAFELLRWRELSNRKRVLFIGIIALSPVVIYYAIGQALRYEGYFAKTDVDMGIMVPIKILFFLATALFVFVLYRRNNYFSDWSELTAEDRNNLLLGCIGYLLGLCLIFSSYFLPMMNRVGWYFTIYEGIYMGMLLKTKDALYKYIFGWCVLIIIGYGFITSMTDNAQGTMPYLFIWQ